MVYTREQIYETLKGETLKEKLKDLEERIWQLELVDWWTSRDYEQYKVFVDLKHDLEKKIKEGKNE